MRSLNGGQDPAHPYSTAPVVTGLMLWLVLCKHSPTSGQTRHHERRPTNKILTVKAYCMPVHMGFLTLRCLVLKEKQFTSLLGYNPSH